MFSDSLSLNCRGLKDDEPWSMLREEDLDANECMIKMEIYSRDGWKRLWNRN